MFEISHDPTLPLFSVQQHQNARALGSPVGWALGPGLLSCPAPSGASMVRGNIRVQTPLGCLGLKAPGPRGPPGSSGISAPQNSPGLCALSCWLCVGPEPTARTTPEPRGSCLGRPCPPRATWAILEHRGTWAGPGMQPWRRRAWKPKWNVLESYPCFGVTVGTQCISIL